MTDSGRVFMPDESAKRYSAVSKADEEGAYEPEAPVEGVFENWRTWKKSVRFVNTQSETFFWGPKDETTGRHRDSGSVTGWVTIAPAKPDLETVAYRNPGLETREYKVNYTCPGGMYKKAKREVTVQGAVHLVGPLHKHKTPEKGWVPLRLLKRPRIDGGRRTQRMQRVIEHQHRRVAQVVAKALETGTRETDGE